MICSFFPRQKSGNTAKIYYITAMCIRTNVISLQVNNVCQLFQSHTNVNIFYNLCNVRDF